MLRSIVLFIGASLLFHSCSTEFDLTGQYIDKAVVYGLIDPLDNPNNGGPGHFFRIQKMFLGQASAFDMALVSDSSYFRPEELIVNLVEYDGTNVARFPMDTVTIFTKDMGDPTDETIDFFGPKQRLYRSDRNVTASREYGIEVIKLNLETQDTVYFAESRTALVNSGPFTYTNPSSNSPLPPMMDLYNSGGQTYKQYALSFKTANGAAMYEIWLRFHYRETVNGVTTEKSVEWLADRVTPGGTAGGVTQSVQLNGEAIIRQIGTLVKPDAAAMRTIGIERVPEAANNRDLDVFVKMGGQYLYDFMVVTSASNTGAVQDKPAYSNITNGIGLFSSRTTKEFANTAGPGFYFNAATLSAIESSPYTDGLNLQPE